MLQNFPITITVAWLKEEDSLGFCVLKGRYIVGRHDGAELVTSMGGKKNLVALPPFLLSMLAAHGMMSSQQLMG